MGRQFCTMLAHVWWGIFPEAPELFEIYNYLNLALIFHDVLGTRTDKERPMTRTLSPRSHASLPTPNRAVQGRCQRHYHAHTERTKDRATH